MRRTHVPARNEDEVVIVVNSILDATIKIVDAMRKPKLSFKA